MRNYSFKIESFHDRLPFVHYATDQFTGTKQFYITILIYKNRLKKLEESSYGLSTIVIHVIGEINAFMGIQCIGHIDGHPMILLQWRKVAAYRPASYYFLVS